MLAPPLTDIRHLASDTRFLGSAPAQAAARPEEAFVVAHDELRLDLLRGVHGDADEDEQRGAAEVELVAHAVRNPAQAGRARDEFLNPPAEEREASDVEAGEHELRH